MKHLYLLVYLIGAVLIITVGACTVYILTR
jgi:hypothetical protein